MWLLTSEPKSAWLVLSHDPGAPPVVRFHQAFGSWACSSQHPPPSSNLYPIDSGPLHIISQSASLLFLFSKHLLYQRGQPLAYIPSHPPPPQKRQGKSTTTPLEPATRQLHISNICILWQIFSAIRPPSPSVWLPCVISILSNSPKNSKFLLSCSL